jgi:hypothetical protein
MTNDASCCPCCGNPIINEPGNVCSVCRWELDVWQLDNPDSEMGANAVCLRIAQENYKTIGCNSPDEVAYVKRPEEAGYAGVVPTPAKLPPKVE